MRENWVTLLFFQNTYFRLMTQKHFQYSSDSAQIIMYHFCLFGYRFWWNMWRQNLNHSQFLCCRFIIFLPLSFHHEGLFCISYATKKDTSRTSLLPCKNHVSNRRAWWSDVIEESEQMFLMRPLIWASFFSLVQLFHTCSTARSVEWEKWDSYLKLFSIKFLDVTLKSISKS